MSEIGWDSPGFRGPVWVSWSKALGHGPAGRWNNTVCQASRQALLPLWGSKEYRDLRYGIFDRVIICPPALLLHSSSAYTPGHPPNCRVHHDTVFPSGCRPVTFNQQANSSMSAIQERYFPILLLICHRPTGSCLVQYSKILLFIIIGR